MDNEARKTLRANLDNLARTRLLYWKHRETSMIAKSIIMAQSPDAETEMLMVRVNKAPTVDEPVPRARMEKNFVLITLEDYEQAFDQLPKANGLRYTVDLERGTATVVTT